MMANKDVLYSTGNPIQYSVVVIWEINLKKNGCVCVCVCVCVHAVTLVCV